MTEKFKEYVISVKDLFGVLKKKKKGIAAATLLFSTIFFFKSLTTPPLYEVEGTFREKGKAQSGISSSSLASLILTGVGSQATNQASAIIKSRAVIAPLVEKMGLQASILPVEWQFCTLNTIKKNLLLEWGLFNNQLTPIIADPIHVLKLVEVSYQREVPSSYQLTFFSPKQFRVFENKELIGQGEIGKSFQAKALSFTLKSQEERSF
jgi:hypothetical protein